jgi:phosphonopyruvate decarboxylase
MIGWRGEPGTKDEPQHVHQGRVMIDSLESMELPYIILSEDEKSAFNQIEKAQQTSKEKNTPVILIIRKNTFEKFTYKNPVSDYELGREEAIIAVTKATKDKSAIVCTTGMPSRELFEFRALNNYRHHRDFLTVGGMGHASQIALGIAISQPNRKIYCFDGDGALLMHMGSIAIIGQSEARNFVHIVFNNGVHDSVGGQPTVGFDINFCDIAKACGYKTISSISKEKDINQTMLKTNSDDGPHFIEIKIKPGNRSNIGRPTTSPEDNKRAFVEHLQK